MNNSRPHRSRDNSTEAIKEICMTLDDLKNHAETIDNSKLKNSIESNLIKKHKKSKEKIEKQRVKSKSNEFQNLKLIPKISKNSNKIIENRHKKEVEEFIQKIRKTETALINEPVLEEIKEPIGQLNLNSVVDMFNSRSNLKMQKSAEKVDPSKLSLVDRSKYYLEKKRNEQMAAQIRKNEEIMKECTFKPDLCKSKRGRSLETLISMLCTTDEKPFERTLPAPDPRKSPQKEPQIYAFEQGVNLRKILEKSKPILSYSKN